MTGTPAPERKSVNPLAPQLHDTLELGPFSRGERTVEHAETVAKSELAEHSGMMEHTQIIEPTEADPLTTTRSVKRPRFRVGRPQRLAALLLVLFLGECLWVIAHQELTTNDYRFAQCGREMWEHPSPIAGYYTTCGNLNGDGTF